jgi:hypothetical protein
MIALTFVFSVEHACKKLPYSYHLPIHWSLVSFRKLMRSLLETNNGTTTQ